MNRKTSPEDDDKENYDGKRPRSGYYNDQASRDGRFTGQDSRYGKPTGQDSRDGRFGSQNYGERNFNEESSQSRSGMEKRVIVEKKFKKVLGDDLKNANIQEINGLVSETSSRTVYRHIGNINENYQMSGTEGTNPPSTQY